MRAAEDLAMPKKPAKSPDWLLVDLPLIVSALAFVIFGF
jgi:hypothetical protein